MRHLFVLVVRSLRVRYCLFILVSATFPSFYSSLSSIISSSYGHPFSEILSLKFIPSIYLAEILCKVFWCPCLNWTLKYLYMLESKQNDFYFFLFPTPCDQELWTLDYTTSIHGAHVTFLWLPFWSRSPLLLGHSTVLTSVPGGFQLMSCQQQSHCSAYALSSKIRPCHVLYTNRWKTLLRETVCLMLDICSISAFQASQIFGIFGIYT